MKEALTPEEKAIYLELLQELLNASTEWEIKSIEVQIIHFLNNKRDARKSIEKFDEKAATTQFIRAGILKN